MIAHRSTSLAFVVAAAWLAAACQSSPLRPSAPPPPQPPPASATLVSITGIVSEAATGTDAAAVPLSGATISVAVDASAFPTSTSTDENGWYSLSQPAGAVTVAVSKEGYETQIMSVEAFEDLVLNFELKRSEMTALRRR